MLFIISSTFSVYRHRRHQASTIFLVFFFFFGGYVFIFLLFLVFFLLNHFSSFFSSLFAYRLLQSFSNLWSQRSSNKWFVVLFFFCYCIWLSVHINSAVSFKLANRKGKNRKTDYVWFKKKKDYRLMIVKTSKRRDHCDPSWDSLKKTVRWGEKRLDMLITVIPIFYIMIKLVAISSFFSFLFRSPSPRSPSLS